MIIYSASKNEFREHVNDNRIDALIADSIFRRTGRRTPRSELQSWRNSLQYMGNIMSDPGIPDGAQVGLEYKVPNTAKRIDFLLAGLDEKKRNSIVVVELKQWTEVEKTDKDAVVRTRLGGGLHETAHPSYQAWSYAMLLRHFNSAVEEHSIDLHPCAYLHNLEDPAVIRSPFYNPHLDNAPVFIREDARKLRDFIKIHVKYGGDSDLLYTIDQGRIRPSKSLADSLSSMLKGNQEFYMIDEQKVVYETALRLAEDSSANQKNILIVQGGPGSGKSVVAINLLVEFNRQRKISQYVTKNSAPRAVYEAMLTGSMRRSHISNLFKGTGGYHQVERNSIDVLIVDEAHRLNEKSGMYGNLGENQVKEIINSALFSVFFIDEKQKVTFKDIGSVAEIKKWAGKYNAKVFELELESQYRCNGSDAYVAWVDEVLGLTEGRSKTAAPAAYDFRVFADPERMYEYIVERNREAGKARVVAGYCWPWISKKSASAFDIVIGSFKRQWNLTSDGASWLIADASIDQVGCIHTCQGLEMEYVGVIIGPDLVIRDGKAVTDGSKRASSDQSIKGFRGRMKTDPAGAMRDADLVIKNTYRTLMTRGTKGCAVYCTDPETGEFLKESFEAYGKD
jgi:hypothetical protein